jgi:SAM-dependent methyltransferase
MLPRVLEPEVMDSAEDAADYDAMDHAAVNAVFVDDLVSRLWSTPRPQDGVWEIFDAGTGTAQIPIALLQRGVRAVVTAADAAASMLAVGRRNVAAAGLDAQIHLVLRDCKALPETTGWFDVVMSNSLLHHLPEPGFALRECWRILRPGGLLFLRDLFRPDDDAAVEAIVQRYAGDANRHQQQLFRESLHAALTVDEVRQLAMSEGIPPEWVAATSDRHWTLVGVKSAP